MQYVDGDFTIRFVRYHNFDLQLLEPGITVNKGLIKELNLGSLILLLGFLDYELHVTIIILRHEFKICVNKI